MRINPVSRPNPRRFAAWCALLLVGVGCFAAGADRPNIIFILADDVRWDDLGATGHPFSKTPHIDRVAREGVMFRNVFATTVICSPSRANILTGLHTHAHGIVDNTIEVHRATSSPPFRSGCSALATRRRSSANGTWGTTTHADPVSNTGCV